MYTVFHIGASNVLTNFIDDPRQTNAILIALCCDAADEVPIALSRVDSTADLICPLIFAVSNGSVEWGCVTV